MNRNAGSIGIGRLGLVSLESPDRKQLGVEELNGVADLKKRCLELKKHFGTDGRKWEDLVNRTFNPDRLIAVGADFMEMLDRLHDRLYTTTLSNLINWYNQKVIHITAV